ncbi:hypothetical protein EAX61_14975 [Dokdonia sinensis]|uniref:Uncharacterized protein n=1 Tax=Dokdonia sinensis TaxID=2479847 RepID=A0A3M0FTY1_9FLAO|nr:hypothetical protein [Dokdonia sinensis]RMB56260.1 hypothetical protein EAX61_14975 [Dokdonia sinensis]
MKSLEHPINRFALKLAFFSAVFGLLQTLIYAVYPNDYSLVIGFFHLYPTVAVHLIVLLLVIINAVRKKCKIKEVFLTMGIMLLNIPLAYACAYLVLEIL